MTIPLEWGALNTAALAAGAGIVLRWVRRTDHGLAATKRAIDQLAVKFVAFEKLSDERRESVESLALRVDALQGALGVPRFPVISSTK